MVAAARLRKAEVRLIHARRYADRLNELARNLTPMLTPVEIPLLQGKSTVSTKGLIAISGERGLCGSFNNNVIEKTTEFIQENRETKIISVGHRGHRYFKKHNFNILFGEAGIIDKIDYKITFHIAKRIIDAYLDGTFDEVYILYHRFVSTLRQKLTLEKIIPVPIEFKKPEEIKEFLYEPLPEIHLQLLVHRLIVVRLFQALMESAASEQGARRNAMEAASDNAGEMLDDLTLLYNRTRQTVITREMLDVVVGSESLK